MEIYIKSKYDFSTMAMFDVEKWGIEVATADSGNAQSVVIPNETVDYTGNWAIMDGFVALISATNFSLDGTCRLALVDPAKIFDQDRPYENYGSTYGAFISNAIDDLFIDCDDLNYSYPYISVGYDDETSITTELGDVLFNLYDVILDARSNFVSVSFAVYGGGLAVNITKPTRESRNVTPEDGHTILKSVTLDNGGISKVTVLVDEEGDGSVYSQSHYYLVNGWQISTTSPNERLTGKWIFVTATSDDDPSEVAYDSLQGNLENHKIEFNSDREFGIFDVVTIQLPFGFLTTSITSIILDSESSLYLYKCGTLPVTLTEKLEALSEEDD